MKRRDTLALGAAALALPGGVLPARAGGGPKVLRVALPVAETGFDPARVSDIYSAGINAHIFESLYEFDHLARPVKIRPRLADGMPEHSADFRVWTVRLKPGVLFADDAAFKRTRRELVAEDVVYTFKRFADPTTLSPNWSSVRELGLPGLEPLRDKALKARTPFDYDTPIEGLRALDRHTVRFTFDKPQPRFIETLAINATYGVVAREVVEAYGDNIMAHPVGTGPYRLVQWRRSSLMVLERNPSYREVLWDAEPAADDAEGQAIARRLRGQRLPLIDRVEVTVVEAAQPRWLSFLNAQIDLLAVPQEFANQALPGGELAPNLAKRGIQGWRTLTTFTQLSFFNMEHPVVGGLAPEQVAFRRAVWLALDVRRELQLVFRGQGVQAESVISSHSSGYRAGFKSENSTYDLNRARALLDLYGWVDRDGDGWRETPDGQPLVVEMATEPEQISRERDEQYKRAFDALQVRISFRPAKWPENLKAARAGKLMMWRVGSSATRPDGQQALLRLYGPEAGNRNLARFRLPAFDAVYEQLTVLPDGPEREALFEQAKRLAVAYAPYKVHLHQYADTIAQPWLVGYRRPVFWYDWWHRADIDNARRTEPGA
ncbi:ABC transporter substrate-binding protein [Pseudorhodoferax sp.]|uniref:ABC transporter substrate-binding protein n=1 Tax=Pseudorhodoferax sp. TaxID=1993553 RepID=UPI002DD68C4C|nr:ABC transporter substrate-binding protein [Pseudorhodoferax sp.]